MQAAGGAEDGDAGGVDALTQQQDEIQRRLTAFEDMVAAEEQAADRARQVEIENLTLAVNSAEKLGLKGDDIAAAEALLRDLRAADDLGGGGTNIIISGNYYYYGRMDGWMDTSRPLAPRL